MTIIAVETHFLLTSKLAYDIAVSDALNSASTTSSTLISNRELIESNKEFVRVNNEAVKVNGELRKQNEELANALRKYCPECVLTRE